MPYPQPQCSPNIYQFANMGPVLGFGTPQIQLPLEQWRSRVAMSQQSPLYELFTASHMTQNDGHAINFETPAMVSFPVQLPHPRPLSSVPLGGTVPGPMAIIPSSSLDPSLIYSPPTRPIIRSSRQRNTRPELLASATKRKDSAASSQPRESISPVENAASFTGPGLRRSNTTGVTQSSSAQNTRVSDEMLTRSSSVTQMPRTASPLKRVGKASLGSISEHNSRPRPSVILTVDENGNARTETTCAAKSPTTSIQDRYPGLFDSDTSGDESSDDQLPSRSASFTFIKGEDRRSKAARLDGSVENLDGIDILRSNSRASNKGVTPSRAAIVAAASLRRQGSLRKLSRPTPVKQNTMTRSTSSLLDTCPMDVAGHELSAGVQNELKVRGSWDEALSSLDGIRDPKPRGRSELDAHNRRWSVMSFDQQQHHPSQRHVGSFRPIQSQQRMAPQIRCTCGIPHDQGQMMVQCSSCTQWLHMPCVGLDGSQLPSGFTCFLCTRPVRR